jgi:antitoxin (DNA-binding transcriptional repressor) of toxin-antitoxin stability system
MTVSIEQAQLKLRELIEKSAHGEPVFITQDQKPVAELRSVPVPKPAPVFGSCKGMLTIISDDEDHLGDFAEYMK